VAYLGFGKGGDHGERAECEPITGVWKQSPWSVGQGGFAPLKLKHFLLLKVQWKLQIRQFFFGNLETQKITASYQMQSHMAILIAYCIGMKKDHQTFLLENGKKKHLFV